MDPDEPPDMPGWDQELNQLRAAKAWGLSPREWRQESGDDRALMLMYVLFEGTVEAYRMEWRETKRKAGARPGDGGLPGRGNGGLPGRGNGEGGDQGMFSRMKNRLGPARPGQ